MHQPTGQANTLHPTNTEPQNATNANQPILDALLSDIAAIMQEFSSLQRQLYNPLTPDQPVDEIMAQTYQPRIDELSQYLEERIRKAEGISKPLTQRFLWEQALTLGLSDVASSQAISLISSSLDNALFEDMLMALSNVGFTSDVRTNLVFTLLLPPETTFVAPNTPTSQTPVHPATPRQQRIKQFLETQLLQETDPNVLNAYLDVYHTMSQDQHGLVSATKFWQQLERARSQLAPDQYFNFRLQQTPLTDPTTDMAGLLRDISNTPMTLAQGQSLQSMLSNAVFTTNMPSGDANVFNLQIPEQHQQLLLQYFESSLPTPSMQNRYSLYEYGNQAYAIELLKHRAQAADTFYQRIVDSNNPTEQIALLASASMGGDVLLKKLQQNVALRQKVENQLKQPNLSADTQAILRETLQTLSAEPPTLAEQPVDEYSNTTYYTDEAGTTPDGSSVEPAPAIDSEQPAAQYPGY
jgi:hypothetical protein